MNSLQTPYSEDQLNQILSNFEFYYPESNCFYRKHGNVVQRYSQVLSKWILELDKSSLNSSKLIEKNELTKIVLSEILLRNKVPRNIDVVDNALIAHGW